jgi:hypothetical protein
MGPDIRHFHVADEPNDNPIVVDMSQPQLLEITPYPLQKDEILCKKTNRYIDFARLFSNHGFSSLGLSAGVSTAANGA